MEDEDGLSAFEILKDELRAQARSAREIERRDLSEQFFKSELFLGKYESRFKDLIDSRRRKLRSACISHPGQKRFSQPILEPPILFQDNEPVTKLFAYNIEDKNLTREKIAELFTAHGLSGFHINRVNTVAGTTTVSCDRLEISCEIQCLALLSTFKWSYTSSKTNKSYSGIIKFRQNNAFSTPKVPLRGEVVSVPQAQSSDFKFEDHPFIKVLTKIPVMKQLCSFLKSSDIFNLYQIIKKSDFIASSFFKTAFHGSLEVSGLQFHLGSLELMQLIILIK